jgi:hypothetical protein
MKIAIVRRPPRDECPECYCSVSVAEPVVEQLETVDIELEDYWILQRYYKDKDWMIMQVHDNPKEHVELNLKKALAEEKKKKAKEIAAAKKRYQAQQAAKKKREEKKLEKARQVLKEAGEL